MSNNDYLKAMFGTKRDSNPQTKKIVEDLKRGDFKWDKIRRELEREAEEEDRRKRERHRMMAQQDALRGSTEMYWSTRSTAAQPVMYSVDGSDRVTAGPQEYVAYDQARRTLSQMSFSEVMGIWGEDIRPTQRAQAVEPEIIDDTEEDVVFDDDEGIAGFR